MKIGIAAPISLRMLASHFPGESLPAGYLFPPMAVWVEELISRGHRVVVFTHAPGVSARQTFSSERLTIHVAPQRATNRARDFFAEERRDLMHFMAADRCDIIHAHWTYEFAMAALDSGQPALITAHDAPLRILRYFPNAYRFMRLLMAWQVLRRAPHLTAVSAYLADSYRRYFFYRAPIAVVPNAVSEDAFELGQWRLQNPHTGAFTVATVLNGWKGVKNGPAALESFARLRRRIPDARLVMFGGDYEAGGEAERWARQRNLHEGVEFRGNTPYRDLLSSLARECDVLLHPAKEESFCMAVAEAMSLGLPVVAGQHAGALPELIEHGVSGLLTDISSPDRICEALLSLASSPELRTKIGAAAHISARARFSLGRVFNMYEAEYKKVLRCAPAGQIHAEPRLSSQEKGL